MKRDLYFLIFFGAFMTAGMVASFFFIPNVNPIFILFQIVSVVFASAIIYTNFIDSNIPGNNYTKFNKNLIYILLFLITLAISATFMAEVTLGGAVITSLASVFAGAISYLFLKPYTHYPSLGSPINVNIKPRYLHISLIFLCGFVLRYLVMGRREIPIGNDAPMYLLLALKGSEMPLSELFKNGLAFSSNPYVDTWNFSQLWLTLFLKGLSAVGLDPVYISKLIIPFISSLSILGIYYLGRTIQNEKFAETAALIFALLPTELLFAQLYKEILGEFFMILSLAFYFKLITSFSFKSLDISKMDLILFVFSVILLWKSAITSFTFFILFLISIGVATTLIFDKFNGLFIKRSSASYLLTMLILIALSAFLFNYFSDFITSMRGLEYFRIYEGMKIHPYGYFAMPIMALTNMIPVTLASFYLYKMCFRSEITDLEIRMLTFCLPVLATISIISLFLTSLMGYNLLPGSLFYYNIRLSIYLGIPLSLISSAFVMRLTPKSKRAAVAIFMLLMCNFFVSLSPETTIHSSLLNGSIDEDSYQLLHSINGSERVAVMGDFSLGEYGLEGTGLGYKSWVDYVIYKNTGKDPLYLNESFDTGEPHPEGIILKYSNNTLSLA